MLRLSYCIVCILQVNISLRYLQAPVTAVDNAAPINAWADNSTNGLIKKAVPDGVRFDMVITNAVYFKGSWLHPFDKSLTDKADFTTASNTLAQVRCCFLATN